MAKKYIDADLLIKTIRDNDYLVVDYFNSKDRGMFTTGIMQAIDEQPTADVRENVRGEWIHKYTHESLHDRTGIWCSACGRDALQDSEGYYIEDCETDFCPNCGADMRGEKNE